MADSDYVVTQPELPNSPVTLEFPDFEPPAPEPLSTLDFNFPVAPAPELPISSAGELPCWGGVGGGGVGGGGGSVVLPPLPARLLYTPSSRAPLLPMMEVGAGLVTSFAVIADTFRHTLQSLRIRSLRIKYFADELHHKLDEMLYTVDMQGAITGLFDSDQLGLAGFPKVIPQPTHVAAAVMWYIVDQKPSMREHAAMLLRVVFRALMHGMDVYRACTAGYVHLLAKRVGENKLEKELRWHVDMTLLDQERLQYLLEGATAAVSYMAVALWVGGETKIQGRMVGWQKIMRTSTTRVKGCSKSLRSTIMLAMRTKLNTVYRMFPTPEDKRLAMYPTSDSGWADAGME